MFVLNRKLCPLSVSVSVFGWGHSVSQRLSSVSDIFEVDRMLEGYGFGDWIHGIGVADDRSHCHF